MEAAKMEYWLKNGRLLPTEQFPGDFIEEGTSLYEVFRIIKGIPVFFEQHLNRLKNSSRLINLALPVDDETIRKNIYALVDSNQAEFGNAKLVINYPSEISQGEIYIYFIPEHYPTDEQYKNGVKTVSVKIDRPNPNVKIDRADYRQIIDSAKAGSESYEAVLIDHEGHVSEGGRSNLFMIKDQQVYTAHGEKVLKGINRQVVFKACSDLGFPVIEKDISFEDALQMDAVFLSGTSPHVLPVSYIDDIFIQSADNDLLRKIMIRFDEIVAEYIVKNTI